MNGMGLSCTMKCSTTKQVQTTWSYFSITHFHSSISIPHFHSSFPFPHFPFLLLYRPSCNSVFPKAITWAIVIPLLTWSLLGKPSCKNSANRSTKYSQPHLIGTWLIGSSGSDQDFSPDKPLLWHGCSLRTKFGHLVSIGRARLFWREIFTKFAKSKRRAPTSLSHTSSQEYDA